MSGRWIGFARHCDPGLNPGEAIQTFLAGSHDEVGFCRLRKELLAMTPIPLEIIPPLDIFF
jgi:hypothetical protein